jgi:CysZ protein
MTATARVTEGGAMRRFARGLRYPLAGLGELGRTPALWKHAALLVLLALASLGLVGWLTVLWGGSLVEGIWSAPEGEGAWAGVLSALHAVYALVLWVGLALLAYYVWLMVTSLVTAPVKDALSELVEARRTGKSGPAFSLGALLAEVGRTLRVEGGKLLLYAAVMLPLYGLSFAVPVVGQVLLTIVGWYFTSLFLAFDYLDWPMARRGWGFRARARALVRDNRALALGFGTACWFFLLVPILNVLFIPGAVVAGTNLFVDLDDAGALARMERP